MRERSGRGCHQHEEDVTPRPKTARKRGPERQEPGQIETDMQEIDVDERVGEERPDIGAEAAGKRIADDRMDIVARRDEGERQEELQILGVGHRQHAHRVHQHEHRDCREHDRRHIEYRL